MARWRNQLMVAMCLTVGSLALAPSTSLAYPPDYPPASTLPGNGSPTTTIAQVPSGTIPKTGSNGIGTTAVVATFLALVGVGLVGVSQARRRSTLG